MHWPLLGLLFLLAATPEASPDPQAQADAGLAPELEPGSAPTSAEASAPDAGSPEDASQESNVTSDPGLSMIEEISALEDQLNQMVVSTTKVAQRAEQSPSFVTVVTAEEIQVRGLRSVAEALRTVPGFYDVDDQSWHNVGVRGISGGARARGNVVLVMIDGMPVDDRSTNGNFFGEELIPISAVERIEVIRGPLSAIYGANAYMGLINVITRKGTDLSGVRVVARGALERAHPGGGGALTVGGSTETFDVMLAASYLYLDRSGLALPSSSPRLDNTNDTLASRGVSRNDKSQPKSVFGKVTARGVLGGSLSLTGSLQAVDTAGEFQDFGPLSHGTRIQRLNQNYRLLWERPVTDKGSVSLSIGYFNLSHGGGERLNIGRSDYDLISRGGANGVRGSLEGQAHPWEPLSLLLGIDFTLEDQQLQSYDRYYKQDLYAPDGMILQRAGSVVPGSDHGKWATFHNGGVYAQVLGYLGTDWSAVLNGRVDFHSVYGFNPSLRVGVVYAPPDSPLSAKLTVGESYKAPSAEQLYTQPMAALDIQGNPDLQVQNEETIDLGAAYRLPNGLGEIAANVYVEAVAHRVEFVQTGLYLEAQNVSNEWVLGGELDARVNVHRSLQLRLTGTFARTVASTTDTDLEGMPRATNQLFPPYQLHLLGTWTLPWANIKVAPELSYVGPRAASSSNALELGTAYEIPGHFYTALALSLPPKNLFGSTETSITLRLTNLLDERYAEPGFGGIDVPASGFGAMLTLTQSLGGSR
ncbi:MAG: TonB-dependent receptor [Myxococcales bacterium]